VYPSLEQITKNTKFGKNDLTHQIKMVCRCPECGTYNVMPVNQESIYIECMSCMYWIQWLEVDGDADKTNGAE
jgi:hypothetical protein